MTPPFGFSSRNDVVFDPALDDLELARVRDATAGGRWTDARDLLRRTPLDWDLRDHRFVVLAQAATDTGWTEEWRELEPDSPDAAVLHALSTVHLVTRGRANRAEAEGACMVAADMAPETPTPWLAMLLLARHSGTDDQRTRAFEGIRDRWPWHHHAHRLIIECLAERDPARDDPHHDAFQFAEDVAGAAPADTNLATLPLLALTERYRVLADAGVASRDPAQERSWNSWRSQRCIETAFDWWLDQQENRSRPHPGRMPILNFLAHAKWVEGRRPQAASLFTAIGPHATTAPWSYGQRDPRKSFRAARGWTLKPGV